MSNKKNTPKKYLADRENKKNELMKTENNF